MQATATAARTSGSESWVIAIRTSRKYTDIVPVTPGSLTLRLDPSSVTAARTKNRTGFDTCNCVNWLARMTAPIVLTAAMYDFAFQFIARRSGKSYRYTWGIGSFPQNIQRRNEGTGWASRQNGGRHPVMST